MTSADPDRVEVLALRGVGEVGADGLAALAGDLVAAAAEHGGLTDGDVLAVSSKVVSKALGLRAPADQREQAVAAGTVRVVAERAVADGRVTRVVEAAAGPVMAAAGVDASNVGVDPDAVLLLPADPDGCAHELRQRLAQHSGTDPDRLGVLVTDTAGRAWRAGQTDLALGASGVRLVRDHRGEPDADGRALAVTSRAVGDELAAAADLVKGKARGVPAALLRGLPAMVDPTAAGARALVRTGPGDWFARGHVEAVRAALGAAPGGETASAVGIASTGPETVAERLARALRLTLLPLPEELAEQAGADLGEDELTLVATDRYVLGVLRARVEVALHAEGLQLVDEGWTSDGLRLRVAEA